MTNSYRSFLKQREQDRRDTFAATATRNGIRPEYVEKDFWVCFVLDLLFEGLPQKHPGFFFKGGTSLSKAFHAIHRLSEDIDLVVDRRDLGFAGDSDPLAPANVPRKRRDSALRRLQQKCSEYVTGDLRTALADMTEGLGCDVSADPHDRSGQTLLVAYPTLYRSVQAAYVAPTVKIEGGARSATEPCVNRSVAPLLAGEAGAAGLSTKNIRVISPERTYWEKALILHGRYCGFRDEGRLPIDGDRIARHYYDVAKLTASAIGKSALSRPELLDSVRTHNLIAFRQAWKRFEEAAPGSVRLVPCGELENTIRRDYRAMESMFFTHPPEFAWILDQLRSAEEQINAL